MTYHQISIADLTPGSLDQNWIDEFANKFDLYPEDVDLRPLIEYWISGDRAPSSADLTNAILYELMATAVSKNVEDENDRERLLNSIYCNCLDSGYNINLEELETEEAKAFLNKVYS